MNNDALTELSIGRVKGVLSTAMSLKDMALMLEKEIGLEPFYSMLSMGQSISTLAASIDVSPFQLEYMLTRTSSHRKEYMNAIANKLGKQSGATLERFKHALMLDQEQSAAARHHSAMLDKSLKVLNTSTTDDGAGGVVVNNTIVVRNRDEIPPLPDGLENVIEGEYAESE